MYKAIIFDFFDVIRTDALNSWLRIHNFKLEGRIAEATRRHDRGEIKSDEFVAILGTITGQSGDEVFKEMEAGATVDQEVVNLVGSLHSAYKIGLLSNAPSALLRGLLHDHDLEKYFDEIVISSEVGLIKPQAEIFEHILTKLHVRPEEAVFIDDNSKNVQGAEVVGIKGVVFTDSRKLATDLQTLLEK